MSQPRRAGLAGVIVCLVDVFIVAIPYFVVPGDELGVVAAYYSLGTISPLAIGLLAVIGVIAFLAGAYERSDPVIIAGGVFIAGVFVVIISVDWALSFSALYGTVSARQSTFDVLAWHRWTVVTASVGWIVVAGWYAASLGILQLPR